eukprot:CFRG1240T1
MSEYIIDFKKSNFEQPNFSADAYVLRRANLVETGAELRAYQQSTQKAGEQAAHDLKQHVFEHYNMFIETSREITKLDNDLQDIRSLLSDTNSIMRHVSSICEKSDDDGNSATAQQQMKLKDVTARVDGCPADFFEYPDRHFLMEIDLKEIEEIDNDGRYQEVRTLHFFVCTDIVLVGVPIQAVVGGKGAGSSSILRRGENPSYGPGANHSKLSPRRGSSLSLLEQQVSDPQRYRLVYIWDMERLLLIDINKNNRDPDQVQNAFRLTEPHSGVYQTLDLQAKLDFLYTIHTHQQLIKDLKAVKGDEASRHRKENVVHTIAEMTSEEKQVLTSNGEAMGLTDSDQRVLQVNDWIFEASDDLDVFIAQREFERAVKLIHKTQAFVRSKVIANEMLLAELDEVLEMRQEELTGLLMHELSNPTMKKKDMQRCIALCVQLGQNNRARAMFLRNRADGLRRDLKHVKIEGVTEVYVYKLSQMFFNYIKIVVVEFLASFSAVADRSALVVWAASQAAHFVTIFKRQVFMGGTFSTTVKCMSITRENSIPVEECGMELFFIVCEMVKDELQNQATEKIDSINYHADQLLTSQQPNRVPYQHHLDTTPVLLHPSTKYFCEQVEQFSQDITRLDGIEIDRFLVECVCSIVDSQVQRLLITSKEKAKGVNFELDIHFVTGQYYAMIRTTVVNKYPAAKNIFRMQKVSLNRAVDAKQNGAGDHQTLKVGK